MLINFHKLCIKYGLPDGIIHLGAHKAEEYDDYKIANIKKIIWVEANPELISFIINKVDQSNNIIINSLLSDKDDIDINFNITKNLHDGNSQSSSILDLELHKIYHPHVIYQKSIKLKTKKLSTLLKLKNIDPSNYDFLNIDLQGYELQALKGYEDNLKYIKYIYTEVNEDEIYKNCTKINDLDNYLNLFNFKRVETNMTPYKWGDAFYIKQNDNTINI